MQWPLLDRRGILSAFASTLLTPSLSLAQDKYPNRPITLLLPYAAGGGTDTIARVFAKHLEDKLGGTIIVDNRPGGAGVIATEATGNAKPDGHTLLIGNQGPMVVTPHLVQKTKADPELVLDPVALIADAPLVIVVGPKQPVKSLADLIATAKAKPDELNYASASNGSASHLAAVLLDRAAGITTRHVAYRGAGPALNDLVGGHVDFMITTVPSAIGLIEAGKLTALAVTGSKRMDILPNVPTADEAGLAGYTASTWYGLMAPKGLPGAIRVILEAAVADVLQRPELLARLKDDGATPSGMKSEAFGRFMAEERKRWGAVVQAANISLKD